MFSFTGMQKTKFGTQRLPRYCLGGVILFISNAFLPLCLAVPHIRIRPASDATVPSNASNVSLQRSFIAS